MIVSPCSVTAASLLRKLMLLFLQGACEENWTDIFSRAYDPEIALSSVHASKIEWFQPFPQFLLPLFKRELFSDTNNLKKEISEDRSLAACSSSLILSTNKACEPMASPRQQISSSPYHCYVQNL